MKCEKVEDHVKDLEEVLKVLRKYRVKLSLKKCMLRVAVKNFLRFIVS